MSRAWNWRDTSLERVAIRKSQLLNGELTEDTEKVEDASHRREICVIVIPEWQWWRGTAILITQCLGLRWRGGCVTLQGICDSKWWTNDIWSGYRMWACWKQKIRVLGKTNGKVNHKRQEKTLAIIAVKDTGPKLLGLVAEACEIGLGWNKATGPWPTVPE